MYYSIYNYQITPLITNNNGPTWIFLADGPGLGCDYLKSLALFLDLPGTTLLSDFPQDGNNNKGILKLSYWKKGLLDLIQTYTDPIIIAHGFAGMLILDTPEIEPSLKGLVLINVPLANDFSLNMQKMQQHHQLPDLVPAAAQYHLQPSKKTYQAFWQVYKYYCFTPAELILSAPLCSLFAFNNDAYYYALSHFYSDYQCHWYPQIPTLTITSEYDHLCLPNVFKEHPHYQKSFIHNKIISNAGHFPWLLQAKIIKHYLMTFENEL